MNPSTVAAPTAPSSVAAPKPGDGPRGLGEKFAVNPNTGTASLTIPLPVSSGRSGMEPGVALVYDSGFGNGPFGRGWRLDLPEITRQTDRGLPRYRDDDESDVFVLAGAEDLTPVLRQDGSRWVEERVEHGVPSRIHRYRPRVEGIYARVERVVDLATGQAAWRTISRDGVTSLFGRDAESRVADPDDPTKIFTWLLCETVDDRGNALSYRYRPEDVEGVDRTTVWEADRPERAHRTQRYLSAIRYGNTVPHRDGVPIAEDGWHFEVVFDYGDREPGRPWQARADPFSRHDPGFEVRTHRLCRAVLMVHHFPDEPEVGRDCVVRSMRLGYRDDDPLGAYLTSITQAGHRRAGTGTREFPPIELDYGRAALGGEVRTVTLPDGSAFSTDGAARWIDLDGDGIPGLLTESGGQWRYAANLGDGVLARPRPITSMPAGPVRPDQLTDLNGDGGWDLVVAVGATVGAHARSEDGWGQRRELVGAPNLAWGDPNLAWADLTGDGTPDILRTDGDSLTWWAALGPDGFTAPNVVVAEPDGPRVLFADDSQLVQLADMTGDGHPDLVRVRPGEVCYWPFLGYGRFGQQVQMADPPALVDVDPRRIRLADVDGSGTADLIHVEADRVTVYANAWGNSWRPGVVRLDVPATDSATSVEVVDVLGTGTLCLVWSTPVPGHGGRTLRFLDLVGGVTPNLLCRVRNGLGARTTLEYASSVSFALADAAAGAPWVTRLPFPVRVVRREVTEDVVGRARFVSEYRYAHGHFDTVEREFRGFARVERRDTDFQAALTAGGTLPDPANLDPAFACPAAATVSWFHTGSYTDGLVSTSALRDEYFGGSESGLPDVVLPDGLDPEDARQAARALKGALLRTETYGLDGSAAEPVPYEITETAYLVRREQPRGPNRDAVFAPFPVETLTSAQERDLGEPRRAHELILAIDPYGSVLRSAMVHYGRTWPGAGLADDERRIQARTVVAVTERTTTNAVDSATRWRTPLPARTRVHDLTGVNPLGGRFDRAGIAAAFTAASEVDLAETEPGPGPARRCVSDTRVRYRSDDLTTLLPDGVAQPRAIPGQTLTLAATATLIERTLGAHADAARLTSAGYRHAEPGDPHWWIPDGAVAFSVNPADPPEVELAEAERHFFLPRRVTDGFGHARTVRYDAYDIAVVDSVDALGNHVSAGPRDSADRLIEPRVDYRVLRPTEVTDANGNTTSFAYDTRGTLTGVAVAGKPGEAVGDRLTGFVADVPDADFAAYLADPVPVGRTLLGAATVRVLPDLFGFDRSGAPSAVLVLTRERHGPDAPIQHEIVYSDGLGRDTQHKRLVDAGRWLTSGWTVVNNKGSAVKEYEPFFASTGRFEFATTVGVGPVLLRDPLDRVAAVLAPDQTYTKTVIGPWHTEHWDANDTVGATLATDQDTARFAAALPDAAHRPGWAAQRMDGSLGLAEQVAATKALAHAGTPTVEHLDACGRVFLTVEHNRSAGVDEHYRTRIDLDLLGQVSAVVDGAGRTLARYTRDTRGHVLAEVAQDSGRTLTLVDVAGEPVREIDPRGHRIDREYDALRRPTATTVRAPDGSVATTETVRYGETLPDPAATNHRGRLLRARDGAGESTVDAYDHAGNATRKTSRVPISWRGVLDWSAPVELEATTYPMTTEFDALGRPVREQFPDGTGLARTYSAQGFTASVSVTEPGAAPALVVARAEHDAHGRRTAVEHGNGVLITTVHDPLTGRPRTIRTVRDGVAVQDVVYTYDPVGNPTHVADHAQQRVFFANQVVEPHRELTYDATYRLIEATGREHLGQAITAPSAEMGHRGPAPGESAALGRYRESYRYDHAGNLISLAHTGSNPVAAGWTRTFDHREPSHTDPGRFGDGLSSSSASSVGGGTERFVHDHGTLAAAPHLPVVTADHRGRMATSTGQAVADGAGRTTHYHYDSAGRRGRKVTGDDVRRRERLDLGGFEVYREFAADGAVTLARTTLHIGDDLGRVALLERRVDRPERLLRYQVGDHLGSVTLELDDAARVLTYEEYFPFGATSYQAVSSAVQAPKRFRLTSKEHDEETGFRYHGARYYAPWLARWTSADPIGLGDGPNRYTYCGNNPVGRGDPTGTQAVALDQGRLRELDRRTQAARPHLVPSPGSKGPFTSYVIKGTGGKGLGGHGGAPAQKPGGHGTDPKGTDPDSNTAPPGGEDATSSPGVVGGSPHGGAAQDASGHREDGAAAKSGVGGTGHEIPKPDGVALTELDYAVKFADILDPRFWLDADSGRGASGGIRGGTGPESMAAPIGQVIYIAVNLAWTFFSDAIERGLAKAWTRIAPVLKAAALAPAFMAVGAGGIGGAAKSHANSLKSTKPTWLYALFTDDKERRLLKYGVTSAVKMTARYTKAALEGKKMVALNRGIRSEMIALERVLTSHGGGIHNFEPWARTLKRPGSF